MTKVLEMTYSKDRRDELLAQIPEGWVITVTMREPWLEDTEEFQRDADTVETLRKTPGRGEQVRKKMVENKSFINSLTATYGKARPSRY